MAQKLSKNQGVVFPEESDLVIDEILKKYKLYRETDEIMEKLIKEMAKAKTFQEKKKNSEAQPERKLARIIKEIAEGKISLEDFPNQLQQIFNISPKIAKDLAKDFEKNVLTLARKVVIERKIAPPAKKRIPIKPLPVAPPSLEEPLETQLPPKPEAVPSKIESPAPPEKEPIPREEDTYREPLE